MKFSKNLNKKTVVGYVRRVVEKTPFLLHTGHSVGLITWATKDYEIWLILQNLLYLAQPRTLLEFGSGRSTYYLAEYALKSSAKVLSIEQHLWYCLRVNFGLRFSFLPSGFVKYARVRAGWYNMRSVKKHLLSLGNIDFLFVDGPTGLSYGKRNSESFYDCVIPHLVDVKMIVIDDVQKGECEDMARRLVQSFKLKRYDVKYSRNSILAFLLSSDVSERVPELPAYLRELLVTVE